MLNLRVDATAGAATAIVAGSLAAAGLLIRTDRRPLTDLLRTNKWQFLAFNVALALHVWDPPWFRPFDPFKRAGGVIRPRVRVALTPI